MVEEIFVAELVVGSRAEVRARRGELQAQADRWFAATGSVWLGTDVTEARENGTRAGFRVRARYGPGPAVEPSGLEGGTLRRAATWLGLADRRR